MVQKMTIAFCRIIVAHSDLRGNKAETLVATHSLLQIRLMHTPIDCRPGCGACCVAPSISSVIPGMEAGKPAGVRCVQLTADNRCSIFEDPRRPAVCAALKASPEMCGGNPDVTATRVHAMTFLTALEIATR
jgi:uncharacterized protein